METTTRRETTTLWCAERAEHRRNSLKKRHVNNESEPHFRTPPELEALACSDTRIFREHPGNPATI